MNAVLALIFTFGHSPVFAILILLVCLVAALMLTASFRRVIANPRQS